MSEANEVIEGRASTHGDYSEGARLAITIQREIDKYLPTPSGLCPEEVYAIQMICAKLSRIGTGNPHDVDHWRDIAGYATLVQRYLESKGSPDNGK